MKKTGRGNQKSANKKKCDRARATSTRSSSRLREGSSGAAPEPWTWRLSVTPDWSSDVDLSSSTGSAHRGHRRLMQAVKAVRVEKGDPKWKEKALRQALDHLNGDGDGDKAETESGGRAARRYLLPAGFGYRLATDAERDAKLLRLYAHHFGARDQAYKKKPADLTKKQAGAATAAASPARGGGKRGRGAASAGPAHPSKKLRGSGSPPPSSTALSPPRKALEATSRARRAAARQLVITPTPGTHDEDVSGGPATASTSEPVVTATARARNPAPLDDPADPSAVTATAAHPSPAALKQDDDDDEPATIAGGGKPTARTSEARQGAASAACATSSAAAREDAAVPNWESDIVLNCLNTSLPGYQRLREAVASLRIEQNSPQWQSEVVEQTELALRGVASSGGGGAIAGPQRFLVEEAGGTFRLASVGERRAHMVWLYVHSRQASDAPGDAPRERSAASAAAASTAGQNANGSAPDGDDKDDPVAEASATSAEPEPDVPVKVSSSLRFKPDPPASQQMELGSLLDDAEPEPDLPAKISSSLPVKPDPPPATQMPVGSLPAAFSSDTVEGEKRDEAGSPSASGEASDEAPSWSVQCFAAHPDEAVSPSASGEASDDVPSSSVPYSTAPSQDCAAESVEV